ncbi:putative Membrane protein [Pseudomonas syringae pv. ribicola]|uniref:Putative Membrane protein n=1 Tax=Pseudomonas syringae pv. ribicola TaxID=55398 RepID=A0A0Q0EGS0_PSESI|nr:putative Membrane protein [Pseudomonas syringae pv. ribicola]
MIQYAPFCFFTCSRTLILAAGSLLTLLDDIATLLDDVALATKKTAGVLGDDLALNAQQVTGVSADRELPVVWAVAKGSLLNKAILVPAALLISAFAPWAILPLLMIGGAFLCFEGFEKIAHKWLHKEGADEHEQRKQATTDASVDMVAFEKERIKGAIRTDFILSAEIIVLALGVVAARPFMDQVGVLVIVAVLITVGVYGLVAGIVKLDDLGLYLKKSASSFAQKLGAGLLWLAPVLMKLLSILGTAAMFMVGGGILVHGLPFAHHWVEGVTASAAGAVGGLSVIIPTLIDAVAGIIAGAVLVVIVTFAGKAWKAARA